MSDGLAQIRAAMTDAKAHEANCDGLRATYGKSIPGRAVVSMSDRVQNDAARVVAEIAKATSRRCRELVMLIDSSGGVATAGLEISDAVSAFKGNTVAVVV